MLRGSVLAYKLTQRADVRWMFTTSPWVFVWINDDVCCTCTHYWKNVTLTCFATYYCSINIWCEVIDGGLKHNTESADICLIFNYCCFGQTNKTTDEKHYHTRYYWYILNFNITCLHVHCGSMFEPPFKVLSRCNKSNASASDIGGNFYADQNLCFVKVLRMLEAAVRLT